MNQSIQERPELIIALVCPLGANVAMLESAICEELANFAYRCEKIRVSDLLSNFDSGIPEPDATEYSRISQRQLQAVAFGKKGGADVLARAAIAAIRGRRKQNSGGNPDKAATACAYILRQLKRPEEIRLLRRVYGQSVIVIAGHSPKETRLKMLTRELARAETKPEAELERWARELINTDEKKTPRNDEEAKFGVNTEDAFPLADFFVTLEGGHREAVRRYINLLFGHPFVTPSPDEMAMHQAYATALRSSDERRQVGAVIVKRSSRPNSEVYDTDIVASGMNEVPRRGGGFYWDGDRDDARDQALRRSDPETREDEIKKFALREIILRLQRHGWLTSDYAKEHEKILSDRLLPLLAQTQFVHISEFMRQVHAEMAAIVDAANRGVAVRGTEMYVTTFPCHNCAKHIIAAGIKRVVYLEPYTKSRAENLHEEEISLDPADPGAPSDKVMFVTFTGVAPRQYARLFSMSTRGKKVDMPLLKWSERRATLSPIEVFANAAHAYTLTEREELEMLPTEYKWDKAVICP